MSKLLEQFFVHKLREGPRDATFKPAPAVPVEADPEAAVDPGMDPAMTQDVAPVEMNFFSDNAQSVISKYSQQLAAEGFDTTSLQTFAQSLDQFCMQMYGGVGDPASRQGFEADYQKAAADWSKGLTKFFDSLLKLKSHASQY